MLHKYLVTPDTVLGPFFQAIGTPRLEPDSAGVACDFIKCSLFLPTVMGAASIANMINYDLGALPGCDTVYTAVAPLSTGEGLGVRLFLNPTQTQLTIETNEPTTTSVSVYDAMGKMVWQQAESHGKVNMNVQTWQAGLYEVVLKTTHEVMVKKFLKEW